MGNTDRRRYDDDHEPDYEAMREYLREARCDENAAIERAEAAYERRVYGD